MDWWLRWRAKLITERCSQVEIVEKRICWAPNRSQTHSWPSRISVGRSDHWAIGDSWWARSNIRYFQNSTATYNWHGTPYFFSFWNTNHIVSSNQYVVYIQCVDTYPAKLNRSQSFLQSNLCSTLNNKYQLQLSYECNNSKSLVMHVYSSRITWCDARVQ